MKILITGNMGYVGPNVISHLNNKFPEAIILGFDMGYFAACLTSTAGLPETILKQQNFGDIRNFDENLLEGVDVIIHLAAISNDPMGSKYEAVTLDVNFQSSVRLAQMAKKAGVKKFVFASSCSMYGAAEGEARTETSPLNPLTAYARSKVFTEQHLEPLADAHFGITCLRFATACGMSARLRLDLVLNDFVASAVASGKINILSDGSPWRPLIHVKDMARAIEWAIVRDTADAAFLAVNAGSNEWNYQVKDLALAVNEVIPGTEVIINQNAAPDKRSYKVSFELFKKLAPEYLPAMTLHETIKELKNGLEEIGFHDGEFRSSQLMRLNVLTKMIETNVLNHQLEWQKEVKKQTSDLLQLQPQ